MWRAKTLEASLIALGPAFSPAEFPYPVQVSTFDVMELKR
jgi:hypothetical protein